MKRFKPLILAILALAVIPIMGAEDSCAVEEEEPSIQKQSGGTSSGGVAQVGDKVSLKGTTYEVTNVKTAKSVGDQYTGATADGIFVIVDLSLTNEKDEPATIIEDNLRLVSGGKEFTTSSDAIFAYPDQTFLLEEIQPGLTKDGKLVYDIPKGATKDAVLQVTDFWSDSTGEIDLGL
jgi:hypothetical protein